MHLLLRNKRVQFCAVMGIRKLSFQILFVWSANWTWEKSQHYKHERTLREARDGCSHLCLSAKHLMSPPGHSEVGRERRASRGVLCPAQPRLRAQDQLRQRLPTHLLAVRAGEVVRCCLQMMLQGFWRGVLIYTLHTPECGEKGQSL